MTDVDIKTFARHYLPAEEEIKTEKKVAKDIRCGCGRKVAEKKADKVKVKCVKCKQVVEV